MDERSGSHGIPITTAIVDLGQRLKLTTHTAISTWVLMLGATAWHHARQAGRPGSQEQESMPGG